VQGSKEEAMHNMMTAIRTQIEEDGMPFNDFYFALFQSYLSTVEKVLSTRRLKEQREE